MFAETVKLIKTKRPKAKVEVLIPDFMGKQSSILKVAESTPHVIAHNMETMPSLYHKIRKGADYSRSLKVLREIKNFNPSQLIKSGLMLGLGESREEVLMTIKDIAETGCDFLSIGQYLAPSRENVKVARFATESDFEFYRNSAIEMGFKHAESGPFVRSSYNAAGYSAN